MNPLPRPPTGFIGRAEELAETLAQLVAGARLITLTGLGGVGKTRLALAVGAARGGDVAYCDAVGLHSLPELAIAFAAALDLEISGLDRAAPHVAVGLALARARRGRVLLIVDNFEHLALTATDALIDLLSRAPELQLLVTTRVALMRPEETTLQVHPMKHDGPDSPAVELLIARARAGAGSAWQTDRTGLQRLAARLDGLPLALELAAARAHLISPEGLLALLDERLDLSLPGAGGTHPRRGSRDAAVAWSWDQLGPDRRQALARLAVLGGSFDLELAASIVGRSTVDAAPQPRLRHPYEVPGGRAEALEVLEVLARYSMLAPEQAAAGVRYRVLETVKDFALAQIDEAAIEAAHAAIAETLLARVEPHLSAFSRELPPAVASQVARDRDLYLAVLRRGLETPGVVTLTYALRVAVALVPLFQRTGFGPVATEWTSSLLGRAEVDAVPLQTRLGAALVTVVAAASSAETAVIDGLVARVGDWLTAGGNALMITTAFGIVHYYRWDHRTLLALADSLLRSDLAKKSAEVHAYALAAQVSSRRALGDTRADDEGRLAEALGRLAPGNSTTACLLILTRAFLAIHRGDPTRGLEHIEAGLLRSGGTLRFFDALFHLERGRALHDLGRLALADAELVTALSLFDPRGSQRERQETLLDRALLSLELGRYELARELLMETAAGLGTSFEKAWHAALTHALGVLTGTVVPAAGEPGVSAASPSAAVAPSGTAEDGACEALRAIEAPGSEADPAVALRLTKARDAATAAAAHTFRARRALLLLEATSAIAHGQVGAAIAVASDDSAFRAGATWVDLSTRPLIRALLGALAQGRMRGESGVDREHLAAAMWPDERLAAESRDQRLHTAISTLRRLGLDDAIEAHEGGYRIVPERVVVRVAANAWPGPTGELQRARGRGRPPRVRPS